jgi:hypothetical protein
VYIAKIGWTPTGKHIGEWTATGAQFAQPYVYKTLFSKEPIAFEDLCETKSVSSALYLDMNEGLPTNIDICEKVKMLRERVAKGEYDKLSGGDKNTWNAWQHTSDEELDARIAEGHQYHFVGKVGSFCPIKPGKGGGLLLREKDGKYYAATGSKGYRWLEAEVVRALGKQDDIDRSYYDELVDDAVTNISQYGDFEWFISDGITLTNVPT